MPWLAASTASAAERTLNGLVRVPEPLLAAAELTNQITGPFTVTLTVAGALVAVPGQPLSLTVYVKVTVPVTPGGGSNSTTPLAASVIVTVPPAGEVAPTPATANGVGVHPLTPASASVTPFKSPLIVSFMFAWAVAVLFVTAGASFTAVTVISNVCVADWLTPPLAVPPSSVILSVIVAVPFWLAAGV